MRYFLKPLLLLSLLIPTFSFAQGTKNTLSGPSATVQTDGTNSVGAVNIGTQNAGRINFFINNTIRGYFDGTTGALTGVTFGSLALSNNVWLTSVDAAGTGSINVIKVDGSDDTWLNADTGNVIKLAIGGTAEVTLQNDTLTYSGTTGYIRSAGGMIIQADSDGNRQFIFDASSDTDITHTFGDSGVTSVQVYSLIPSTTDADDDATIQLGFSSGSRGAGITLPGEEVSGGSDITYNVGSGDVHRFQVNGTTEAAIDNDSIFFTGATATLESAGGMIVKVDGDAQRLFTFDASSDTDMTLTFGDAGVTALQTLLIKPSTADGDDDAYICLAGGSACSRNGGSFIIVKGNELASVGGDLELSTGVGAGDTMYFYQAANVEMTLDASALTLATNSLILSGASSSVRQPIVNGITAAGTTTSDATALTGVINYVTTVASGTGVKLWEAGVGSVIYVHNLGANALLVYPPTGGQIYGTAVDAGPSVASGSHAVCTKRAAGGGDSWVCFEAGNI